MLVKYPYEIILLPPILTQRTLHFTIGQGRGARGGGGNGGGRGRGRRGGGRGRGW